MLKYLMILTFTGMLGCTRADQSVGECSSIATVMESPSNSGSAKVANQAVPLEEHNGVIGGRIQVTYAGESSPTFASLPKGTQELLRRQNFSLTCSAQITPVAGQDLTLDLWSAKHCLLLGDVRKIQLLVSKGDNWYEIPFQSDLLSIWQELYERASSARINNNSAMRYKPYSSARAFQKRLVNVMASNPVAESSQEKIALREYTEEQLYFGGELCSHESRANFEGALNKVCLLYSDLKVLRIKLGQQQRDTYNLIKQKTASVPDPKWTSLFHERSKAELRLAISWSMDPQSARRLVESSSNLSYSELGNVKGGEVKGIFGRMENANAPDLRAIEKQIFEYWQQNVLTQLKNTVDTQKGLYYAANFSPSLSQSRGSDHKFRREPVVGGTLFSPATDNFFVRTYGLVLFTKSKKFECGGDSGSMITIEGTPIAALSSMNNKDCSGGNIAVQPVNDVLADDQTFAQGPDADFSDRNREPFNRPSNGQDLQQPIGDSNQNNSIFYDNFPSNSQPSVIGDSNPSGVPANKNAEVETSRISEGIDPRPQASTNCT